MAEDSAGNEQGDVKVRKTTQHSHKNNKGDYQMDGQPPLKGESAASDSPDSEGQSYKERSGQKGGKKEGVLCFDNHGRLM
jgi:hypothetical protein